MRVGIVSIFDSTNFGNRLQNYALQQVLLRYADEVVTIKNKPSDGKKTKFYKKLPIAESLLMSRLMGRERRTAMLRFTKEHIALSRWCYWYDADRLKLKKADQCDLYCAGSDQVWSPEMNRTGMFNYLGFAPTEQTFSYAASFGVDRIGAEDQSQVRQGLRHIGSLSVREDAGRKIIEDLTGRTDVQVMADPTLLLSAQEWEQVASAPKEKLPQRFVLSFFLGDVDDQRREEIRKKAEKLECQVIDLMDPASPFYACGPDGFLYLIRHAQFVCTDSFHCCVFSFLFGQPFAVFPRRGDGENMGSRLVTLTERFSLQDRAVADGGLDRVPDTADYQAGYAALEAERAKASAYLSKVFQGAQA